MNKPEIVGYLGRRFGPFDAPFYRCKSSAHPDDVSWLKPLIRLSDHEAASAADKARIAAIEAVLARVAVWIEKLPVPTKGACAQLARIDAALAQQGKESGHV